MKLNDAFKMVRKNIAKCPKEELTHIEKVNKAITNHCRKYFEELLQTLNEQGKHNLRKTNQ